MLQGEEILSQRSQESEDDEEEEEAEQRSPPPQDQSEDDEVCVFLSILQLSFSFLQTRMKYFAGITF